MEALRAASRLPVGSAAWISEERASALRFADGEADEFTFSARNELDWLNEHMAEIFSENQLSVTEIFKTPGKLRGKTPRTARKRDPIEGRAPLSDLFSATPKATISPFKQQNIIRQAPTFQVAEDPVEPPKQHAPVPKTVNPRVPKTLVDSGYHGSQASVATEVDERVEVPADNETKNITKAESTVRVERESDEQRITEGSFQTAREEQTIAVNLEENVVEEVISTHPEPIRIQPQPKELLAQTDGAKLIPALQKERQNSLPAAQPELRNMIQTKTNAKDMFDDMQSPSDGSSPIRVPLVRKSSLTFASLPAREPLTKHSIGNRVSRTSHLEQTRTSYLGRSTGGKSLGNTQQEDYDDEDEMDVDAGVAGAESDAETKMTRMHNKTSTQRLQDQISKLGQSQSQAPRPSKSIPNMALISSQSSNVLSSQETQQVASPVRTGRDFIAPGAFPDDEEDDWIGPATAASAAPSIFSPRPALNKSYTAEVMEGIHSKEKIGESEFSIPKQRVEGSQQRSPFREPAVPERTTSTLGHIKSASTSVLRSPARESENTEPPLLKSISVSHPNYDESYSPTPKSPSRSFRDSPLKAAKDKVSSILKTSRNLFASSAAVSAAAKGSALSPPPKRLLKQGTHSLEDLHYTANETVLYPSLNRDSPSRLPGLGKMASSSDLYDKKMEREAREAQKMDEKLDKLREKEAQKAREFSQQEHERIAAMEKQILAKKEQERLAKASQADSSRVTRSSPRKTKVQLEAEGVAAAAIITTSNAVKDIEMTDASAMGPPEVPRVVPNPREPAKRPMKPAKDTINAVKQAPVVIRVDTGSQRNPQRNLFHPSNAVLAGSLQESLAPAVAATKPVGPQPAVKTKVNTASVRPKASNSSLKSVSSTTGKLKVLEAAAKKKEQEDLEAQRKRNQKLETERKRAALQEGKQQEQRQNEVERQREKEKDHIASQMNTKKATQQILEKRMEIERAKQQRPPAPAPRPQFGTEIGQAASQDKPLPQPPVNRGELGQARPGSRMESTIHRSEDDFGRSVTSTLHNTTKAPPKRPLPQDSAEESQSRPTLQRNGPSNHAPDAKRRKTIEDHDDDINESQPKGHMAPPVRQSSVRPKDGPNKSLFPSGYVSAPQAAHGAPLLHKATLNAQQMHRAKPAHPMDMVQNSKAPINFAPNLPQATGASHKTPARPAGAPVNAAKSSVKQVAKSSPRYQNGDSIDLPEIPTDSEDEDSEDEANNFPVPSWADSPALRQGLMMQESLDPVSVFGLPGEIKLEEVFKNTDRHPRFRARTSSANWSGSDRLTEDEVRKDLEARDRLRREGGWSYGLS